MVFLKKFIQLPHIQCDAIESRIRRPPKGNNVALEEIMAVLASDVKG
jgi:hypothetical protein